MFVPFKTRFITKSKKFIGMLLTSLFFVGFFGLLIAMDNNAQLRASVMGDVKAFGLAGIAGYTFYRYSIATNLFGTQKKKSHRHGKKH